jgi:uncharacterized protein (DUF4415 family)
MTIQGVHGVLQTLLTEPVESGSEDAKNRQRSSRKKAKPATSSRPATKARLGRPPQSSASSTGRQKVTVRIRPDLIDAYRDQSWDARCSLSRLVEKAMSEYLRQSRDQG